LLRGRRQPAQIVTKTADRGQISRKFFDPRVPAIVVSPRVRAGVSHEVFDHTSIIKTCLVRFCRRDDGFIPDMGARVSAANHLRVLLDKAVQIARPREAALKKLASALGDWRADSLRAEVEIQSEAVAPDPVVLTDFQEDYVAAREAVLESLTPTERARAAAALGMSTQAAETPRR
jgi:hypothetical protein